MHPFQTRQAKLTQGANKQRTKKLFGKQISLRQIRVNKLCNQKFKKKTTNYNMA